MADSSQASAATPRARSMGGLAIYLELAKARLCTLVLLTTLVGFVLASGPTIDWLLLLFTLIGTGLAAFGANALNQCQERHLDAKMERTCGRPLPSGRITPRRAQRFAYKSLVAGPLILALLVNPLAGALAALTELVYLLAYTPLKTRTPMNTLVGALVGALPPMIGWAGATGSLGAGAWLLAGLLFFWQLPHFLALAWLYRDDYARGGFRMLPAVDEEGTLTCNVVLLYSVALVPTALSLTVIGLTGPAYAVGSVLLAAPLIWTSWQLHRRRSALHAKRVFLASVTYLPLLIGVMLADRRPAWRPPLAFDTPTIAPTPLPDALSETFRDPFAQG